MRQKELTDNEAADDCTPDCFADPEHCLFFLMGYDKQCAREQRRRIPERTLFLSAAFFGAFGGTLGMFAFRHKTKHWYFRIFFPLLMLLQAGIIGYLWSRGVF